MSDVASLPFVSRNLRRGERRCFWRVEPTGDYGVDCRIGVRYALEYMRLERAEAGGPGYLQLIVGDMPREMTGIEIGFLGAVGRGSAHGLIAEETRMYWYVRAAAVEAAKVAKKAAEKADDKPLRRRRRSLIPALAG